MGKRGTPRNITRELEVVRLREQGLTLTDIGHQLGISGTAVANALKRQGRGDLLSGRGFASLSPERRREIASKGGKAAHAAGKAHTFTTEEARVAGSKGCKLAHALGRAHEFTVEEARAAGKKGGRAGRGTARGPSQAMGGDRAARLAEEARRQAEAAARGRGHGRVTPAKLARRAEMAELWAAGLTLAEIGERFGVTRQAVGAALRAVEGAAGSER
jgi:DNA-binding CsgD family transcriptional regulator